MPFTFKLSRRIARIRRYLWLAAAAGAACVPGDRSAVTEPVVPGSPEFATLTVPAVNECSVRQPGWIWCDDFEQNRLSSYFEYDNAGGNFVPATGVGLNGSTGMRARWSTAGQMSAGALHLAFGKTPQSYFRPVDAGTAIYRDVYWRVYVKNQAGWTGGGADKLSRAISFASTSSWAEAMIAHVWSGSSPNQNYLLIDPASGTDASGSLLTTTYNDFANMRWLGPALSATPMFDASHVGQWYCVEAHAKLNDPGQTNGVFQLWINGAPEAQHTGLNWVGSFSTYGINALFLENYWNAGAPQPEERYFDNFVVSTQPIGCGSASPAIPASVAVSPTPVTQSLGATQQLTATVRDAGGNVLTGQSVTWTSTNPSVASVSGTGLETGVGAGTTTITATSGGISGSAAITVNPIAPGTVSDLVIAAKTDTSVTLSFTEVNDGTGKAANYDIRFAPGTISWGSAANVSRGTCATPVAGTGIGAKRTCTVLGLAASTAYQVELVAFRGTLNVNAVFGSLSNVASGTTAAAALAAVASVTVSPSTVSQAVGATQQLTATLKDVSGNVLTGRTVTWTSSNGAVAVVGANGLETAMGSGTATITAASAGVSGAAAITASVTAPGTVTDLAVAAKADTSVTLAFTEVTDGTGQPASYDVRYAAGTISWGSATEVSRGTCTTPVAGTSVGAKRTCTVLGLSSSTAYQLQVVAFRGTLNVNAVFGTLSNVAPGTTSTGPSTPSPAPVATVAVSPGTASFAVGGTQQLTATLRDASGNVLMGRTVTWTSSALTVATVSGSGLVTALLAGTTTITATSEGQSGTATVTVTALPPPPSSGGWTNEPTGVTVVSDYGFNDLFPITDADTPISGGSGWNSIYNGNGYMTRGSDASAPLSPSNVVQFLYPIGFPGSQGPATAWHPLPGLTRAYVGQWWKVSNPWQGHASNVNKIGYLVVSAGSIFLAMYGPPGGPYELRVFPQFTGVSQDVWLTPNVAHVPVTLGTWHKLEWLVDFNGGVVKWWMDGQLLGSYTGVPMPTSGFIEYHLDPVWGGCCDTKTETDYYWFDHIHISGN